MLLSKQQGTAIIIALLIVGLAAVIALSMMSRLSRDIRRTELLLNSTQVNLYAQGSVAWALDSLREHWLKQKKNQIIDKLPLSSPVNVIHDFQVSSTIYDAEGCFNLNNLNSSEWAAFFQRLLLNVDPQLGTENAQKITKSVANWVAPVSNNINEDLYYLKLPQPYRAPHRPMASASELRLVKGVTPQLYQHLAPYVTALPENTLINVNTAPLPVLQSLSPSLSAEAAKTIEVYRQQFPFVSIEQFSNMDLARNNSLSSSMIEVSSHYFLIKTLVEKNRQQLLLFTLAQRATQDNKALIRVLRQGKGGT